MSFAALSVGALIPYAGMVQSLASRVLDSIHGRAMLRAGDRVGVAVSGGADSVALLTLLLELREKLGIVLSVAHFNHKLRGRASEADEKFVTKLAAKHQLPFHVERADIAAAAKRDKVNLEETARRARYAFFSRLSREGHVNRVAVAHTADDQAETVLAHILRGTGLTGLAGIHPIAGCVVRPLLRVRHAELHAYLKSKRQSWREDATNQDIARMRARIRKKLLPLLEKQFQPAVVEHLVTLAELTREDEAFLDAAVEVQAAALSERNGNTARIRVTDLLAKGKAYTEEHRNRPRMAGREPKTDAAAALSKRVVRKIVKAVKLGSGQLGAHHVDAVLALARCGENGKSLCLPGGVEVRRDQDVLIFCGRDDAGNLGSKTQPRQYEFALDLSDLSEHGAEVPVPQMGCVFRFRVIDWPAKRGDTNTIGLVLDRDALRTPVVLRNWRPGDRLQPQGHRTAHKLKRLLSQRRVSHWDREGWPILTSGGVVAWARGFRVAAEFAASERTRAGIMIAEEPL
jgi:tRNA(Ile)-lysidine synthase